MALLQLSRLGVLKNSGNMLKMFSVSVQGTTGSNELMTSQQKLQNENMPIHLENPYVEEKPKCILCQLNIQPSYKNVRLLSQFVSRYTGRVYGRHITGLCEYKQKKLVHEIKKAREVALMPKVTKNPNYLEDPDLYDETKPLRAHNY